MTVAAAANVVSLDKNTTCGWVSAAPAVAKERNEHTFINFALFFSFLIHSFWLEAGAALFRKLILTHFEYFRRSCRHRRLCLCCGLHSTQKKDQKNSFWNYTILFYLHTCILIYIHFSTNINLVNLFCLLIFDTLVLDYFFENIHKICQQSFEKKSSARHNTFNT